MMYWNLLSDSLSWGDRLNYMGVGVLLGMVVVFAVLALLWLILELFGVIARRGKKEKATDRSAAKSDTPAPQAVPAASVALPEAAPAAPAAFAMSDDEIVAAITAALTVYLEVAGANTPSINGFRVVSFKKVGNAAHWNQN